MYAEYDFVVEESVLLDYLKREWKYNPDKRQYEKDGQEPILESYLCHPDRVLSIIEKLCIDSLSQTTHISTMMTMENIDPRKFESMYDMLIAAGWVYESDKDAFEHADYNFYITPIELIGHTPTTLRNKILAKGR